MTDASTQIRNAYLSDLITYAECNKKLIEERARREQIQSDVNRRVRRIRAGTEARR